MNSEIKMCRDNLGTSPWNKHVDGVALQAHGTDKGFGKMVRTSRLFEIHKLDGSTKD